MCLSRMSIHSHGLYFVDTVLLFLQVISYCKGNLQTISFANIYSILVKVSHDGFLSSCTFFSLVETFIDRTNATTPQVLKVQFHVLTILISYSCLYLL